LSLTSISLDLSGAGMEPLTPQKVTLMISSSTQSLRSGRICAGALSGGRTEPFSFPPATLICALLVQQCFSADRNVILDAARVYLNMAT
jgi:hypothetical protein